MMETLSIREILDQVSRGQIRIPAFQRGFVWEPERVAYLMDSIYKNYPFGSLMFWRTKEKLKFDKNLGPFVLPDPKEDYPVDYVLDGQQRLTSIFGVFQSTLARDKTTEWRDIYFDLGAEANAQDSQFVALKPDEVDTKRHFPINTLFDSVEYRAATSGLSPEQAKAIDEMQAVFKETKIPVQISKTEDKATVAIIFERVNRQGVELDTLQLLSAWTWSEEFQLREQFVELAEELSPFGFADVGGDTELLLRCCSAVLAADAAPSALMSLNGERVRANFERVTNGVKYAVDYLKSHFCAESLSNLPFSTMLVPLAVFFAVPGNKEASYNQSQSEEINKWFWRTAYSKRYSSGVLRNLKTDIANMNTLREKGASRLGDFQVSVDEDFFKANMFGLGNVNTKTFLLMLAGYKPRSFISGAPVDLKTTLKAANRSEFHHMMPRSFLNASGQTDKYSENALANFCFLSRADNRQLGGDAPSAYKAKMAANTAEIVAAALAPMSLFDDDYNRFVDERSAMLASEAKRLCGI